MSPYHHITIFLISEAEKTQFLEAFIKRNRAAIKL
jgi:hypothetical protein